MNSFFYQLKNILYSGRIDNYCPICKEKDITFKPLPDFYRKNAEMHGFKYFGKGEMTSINTYSCSNCGASDRERLYAYWLDKVIKTGNIAKESSIIHFAPEPVLSAHIRNLGFSDYQTADFSMEGVDYQVDLMSLPFPDNSFDFFICSHVLEHVPDDSVAIRELLRITRKGGRGILMAPITVGLSKTIENPSAISEEDRWRLFGQYDHVRLYAHSDYVKRLKEGGFQVEQLNKSSFGERTFKSMGLKLTSILYIVSKRK
jgi:SAM-dependent methyltransferase